MGNDFCHARQLVEMAAITAYHGEAYLRTAPTASRHGLQTYWLASRQRLDAWQTQLRGMEQQASVVDPPSATPPRSWPARSGDGPSRSGPSLPSLAEEILGSEPLTRIWTAIGCQMARQDSRSEAEPFVRSAFYGHLDVRQRLLRLVFEHLPLAPDNLTQLDRLRRRCERWTDLLLGYLGSGQQVAEFAFEPERVLDFAASLRGQPLERRELSQSLLLASLRSAFPSHDAFACPHPLLNARIIQAVLTCFAADLFHATGQFRSLWELRLAQTTDDTAGMLASLAAEH